MTVQIAAVGRRGGDPREMDTRTGTPMTAARLAVNVQDRTRGAEEGAEAGRTNAPAPGGIGEMPRPRPNPYRINPASPWFHVVNVSGGRSSAYMLKQILDAHAGESEPLPCFCAD